MDTIYNKENKIFNEIKSTLSQKDQERFVMDGLCWANICCGENLHKNVFVEMENLYLQRRPRIVFLLKEPNKNDGEDYRDWHWSEKKGNPIFGDSIAFWLEGILSTTTTYIPVLKELRQNREIFAEQPFVILNVKKISGGGKSQWNVIFDYAKKYAKQLQIQIGLYNPDIIICCGSTDNETDEQRMLTIARKYLYPNSDFNKINNFCYYCNEKHILLIDSYHPSCRKVDDEDKFNQMFKCYHNFLKENICNLKEFR